MVAAAGRGITTPTFSRTWLERMGEGGLEGRKRGMGEAEIREGHQWCLCEEGI